MLRILRHGIFPKFKMQLSLPHYGIDSAESLSGLHLVADLYINGCKLAVKSKIILAVLHKDTFVVSRHDEDLLHSSAKYGLSTSAA